MSVLVIGIGNRDRGDDGAGLIVVEQLQRLASPDVRACAAGSQVATLWDLWHGADRVVLVDAVQAEEEVGTIWEFDCTAAPLPADLFAISTHGQGPAQAIEMARVLGELPQSLRLYAIIGREFSVGQNPSAAVARASAEVARRILWRVDAQAREVAEVADA